ncbi:MAG TPA: GntR family transcriptional regulator [Nevskiaceae bacterium]|nr:GntR family transcriptional regulator [Nevskiaceae bacterium]
MKKTAASDACVARTCMRDPIRDAIVSRILDGRFPPGTRLKELALAREFNTSQAPVREALRELETLGLVESERYRGTRVRDIDIEELHHVYELRIAIEEAAARRAVPCRKEDLQRLTDEIARMQQAIRDDDVEAYMVSAVNFHRDIVQMSGNRVFVRAWESMAWDVRARVAAKRIGLIGHYLDDRRRIVSALRAGQGARAGRLLRQLIEKFVQRLLAIKAEAEAAPPAQRRA